MTQKALGIITARGGSKRLPGKHLLTVAGVPLLKRCIDFALTAERLHSLVLSTDDSFLADKGKEWGVEVPFIRPKELARDDSKVVDVLVHAAQACQQIGLDSDVICLLQPTSPFRTGKHIDQALKLFFDSSDALSLMSVNRTPFEQSWLKRISSTGFLEDITINSPAEVYRGQGPALHQLNGAIYIMRTKDLRELRSFHTVRTLAYEMSMEDSVDIDEQLDLDLAEIIAKRTGR